MPERFSGGYFPARLKPDPRPESLSLQTELPCARLLVMSLRAASEAPRRRLLDQPVLTRVGSAGFTHYSPPYVDRTWDMWGSYYNMPKAIFYVLEGAIGLRF